MSNARTLVRAVLEWLGSLEELLKRSGKTLFYWRKLLKGAGVNWSEREQQPKTAKSGNSEKENGPFGFFSLSDIMDLRHQSSAMCTNLI